MKPARRSARKMRTYATRRVAALGDQDLCNDPRIRENFIERVFAFRRLRSLFAKRWTAHKLQEPRLTAH